MVDDKLTQTGSNIVLSEKFDSLISSCDYEHLQYCKCQEKQVIAKYREFLKLEMDDLKEKGLLDNKTVFESRKVHALGMARKEVAMQCMDEGIKCHLEREDISLTLQLFGEKFDLNDPRVYMVVKSVISHQLSVFRMQLQSNYRGILQQNVDKEGNPFFILNPVEMAKMNFDNSIIVAVEKLNKIMYGDKVVNTNINLDVLSIKEILGEPSKDDLEKKPLE